MIEGLTYARPEIFLSIFAMFLLMLGVFRQSRNSTTRVLFHLATAGMVVAAFILCDSAARAGAGSYSITVFSKGFIFDNFAYYAKMLILLLSASICVIAANTTYYAGSSRNVFEFPVLMVLAVVGMFVLVSANDLMAFYIGLELQSLALYILVAINRDSTQATESGVKYFVLGALASGVILFGISLIYGFSGSTNLSEIATILKTNQNIAAVSPGMVFGIVLVMAGLFFKLSAVPMHMWAPDVYEGSTKTVVAFIATAPKVAALAFFIRFLSSIDVAVFKSFMPIILIVSILSMVLGAFAALRQSNIKRLLAYSSIANMGYMLIALVIGSRAAIEAGLIYLTIYMIGSIGIFAIISLVQNSEGEMDKISDLAGMGRTNPILALALATLMFSIAGIPPMAGFFAKFFLFKQAIASGFITLAIIGVVSSVVACFYYLRIVKVMYFDEGASNIAHNGFMLRALIAFSVAFTLLLLFFTSCILDVTSKAVAPLF